MEEEEKGEVEEEEKGEGGPLGEGGEKGSSGGGGEIEGSVASRWRGKIDGVAKSMVAW